MSPRTENVTVGHVAELQNADTGINCEETNLNQPGERARGFGREPSRDWRADAACRGLVDAYFDPWDADDKDTRPNATAAYICERCPVRRRCLIEAIMHKEPHGVWGGLTQRQRKSLVRARHRVRCPICKGSLLACADEHAQACLSCGVTWKTIAPSRRNVRSTSPERQSTSKNPQRGRRTGTT
jgi:WhiB family redox-sensing transcriptional regulator